MTVSRRRWLADHLAGGVALGAAVAGASLGLCPGAASAGRWLPPPLVPELELADQDGRSRPFRALLRRPLVVVSFFFTGCAAVCPPQTALLREARRSWRERPDLRDLLLLSVSVDPHDRPEDLRRYAGAYGLELGTEAGWLLLCGQGAALGRLLQAFELPPGSPDRHPALLWLGETARGRWTRTSSLNPPALVTRMLEELCA